tara:strand:- start:446 stop:838 length:393 start_codon:yes stop_codon:yes gene_type:complete
MSTLAVATIKSASSAAPVFQNSSGTEKGQLAKSWVNFQGSGTVAINDSFNVSSITDSGLGKYIVTMENAMANTNYAVVADGRFNDADGAGATWATQRRIAFTTTTYGVRGSNNQGQFNDLDVCCGVVFGD